MSLDRDSQCEASGLTVRRCIQSGLCDCFPDTDTPYDLHPDMFQVGPEEECIHEMPKPWCATCLNIKPAEEQDEDFSDLLIIINSWGKK